MADVREFWLVNSQGTRYSLHDVKTFLNEPEGLGYGVDLDVLRLGNSNAVLSESYNLGSVSGELLFMGTREEVYNQYFLFAQFLYFRPITLHYKTPDKADGYYCQVRVTALEKTEVNHEDMILHCPITMYRQTMWYNDTENVIEARNNSLDGKMYPLYRPYHYGAVSTSNIELYNAGVADAPLLIEVMGESTDVAWSLYDSANNKYGAGKVLGTYDTVTVNSDDLNESIVLTREGSFIPNAVNYQDLSVGDPREVYVTFLKLRPGLSRMTFTFADNTFDGYVRVTWRNAYVTV